MNKYYNEAINLHYAGMNVVPLINLRPAIKWSKWQKERQDKAFIEQEFTKPNVNGIAVICGQVSGGLEVIDIDSKNALEDDYNEQIMSWLTDTCPDIVGNAVIANTKSGGIHIFYRCDKIEGNQKLIQRTTTAEEKQQKYKDVLDKTGDKIAAASARDGHKQKVLVETRGEGGFIYVCPTAGYELKSGDLTEIPPIMPMQRDILMGVLRSKDEVNPVVIDMEKKTSFEKRNTYKVTPWEAYDERGDIIAELQNVGWEVTHEQDDKIYLRRPGTDAEQSGNFHTGKNLLYIFSTNTPFPAEKAMTPSAAYAHLHHDGDFSESSKALLELGYGEVYSDEEQADIAKIDKMIGKGEPASAIKEKVKSVDNIEAVIDQRKEILTKQKNASSGPFWQISDKGAVTIKERALAKFCYTELNYCIYYSDDKDKGADLVKINLAKRTIEKKHDQDLKRDIDRWILANADERIADKVAEAVVSKKKALFNTEWYEYFRELREEDGPAYSELGFSFMRDTPDHSYHFFKNGVVKIDKNGYNLVPYSDLPDNNLIWKEQVIDQVFRAVDLTSDNLTDNLTYKFCRRISDLTQDKDLTPTSKLSDKQQNRWGSTCTNIGWLCHNYKDEREAFALVCKEDTDDNEQGGGTGKGVFFKMIDKVRNLVTLDGKTFDPLDQFAYQRVEPNTQVLAFQDLDRNLNTEALYNVITDGVTVRKLYQKQKFIPFSRSPKIAMTTNYDLSGEGDHFFRRFKTQLFSRYFNKDNPIDNELGMLFNWKDDKQWILFYNFVFDCIKKYLSSGLIEVSNTENVKIKRIKTQYSTPFFDWVENWVATQPKDKWRSFRDLHEELQSDTGSRLGAYKFNRGVEDYCEAFGVQYEVGRITLTSHTECNKKGIQLLSGEDSDGEDDLPF